MTAAYPFASLLEAFESWHWLPVLAARVAVGGLFAVSGAGKVFVAERQEQMREAMRETGLPFPKFNAAFASGLEFVFGVFLALGFLTPVAAFLLAAIMLVSIATTVIPGIQASNPFGWLGEFLYKPEVLYLVILVWLFFSGPEAVSLDRALWGAGGGA